MRPHPPAAHRSPSALAALSLALFLAWSAGGQAAPAPPAQPLPGGLVPFVVGTLGGLANSAAVNSANPEIVIDSDGAAGHFVVTSLLIEADADHDGFGALAANSVEIDGFRFDTRTDNLIGPIDGLGVVESADLMGAPVRVLGLSEPDMRYGGSFPREIVAENAFADDIRVELFARSEIVDLEIDKIRVAGWKRPGDTISVTYLPGN